MDISDGKIKTNIGEVLKMERKVVKEENNVLMDTLTRGIGKMIITKEKALKPGKMELNMLVCSLRARRMEKENTPGQMVITMMETGLTMFVPAKALKLIVIEAPI